MLASLKEEPFDDSAWVSEKKFDGYRALALCDGEGNVELYSRNLLSFNAAYASIVGQLEKITHPCLLDGEIVIEDSKGKSNFQLLQNYKQSKKGTLKYYVFDLLQLEGNELISLPLLQRKELLQMLLKKQSLKNILFSVHKLGKGIQAFNRAKAKHEEGIMAKKADSLYLPGQRSRDWLKIKITNEQEAIVAGITAPQGSRKHFGSLILAVYSGTELQYIGNCGTGFDDNTLVELYKQFKLLFISKSPFGQPINLRAQIQWLKPKLVCQVKFTEWTGEGSMRHPVFLGLRKDKKAAEVVKELPIKTSNMKTRPNLKGEPGKATAKGELAAEATKKGDTIKIGSITINLTNQQKIYWPDEKITKGELVSYYKEIAPVMLPYLKDRPQSMHRFPNGIKAASFYQKDVEPDKIPSWLYTEEIYSDSNKGNIDYLICNDKATLVYMANLGCIEINPWNSRMGKIENPDWMVIDLDPEEIAFKEVVKTAQTVRKVLDTFEIEGYCKTSGATGLHIFIPLAAKYPYELVRNFANLLANRVHELIPDITSVIRQPAKRKKKVYVDFLQNSKGQTLAAPYSVRPRPGATVSTPLDWSEVNEKLNPGNFNMQSIFKRLEKKGDLWKPVIGKGVNLSMALKKIRRKTKV